MSAVEPPFQLYTARHSKNRTGEILRYSLRPILDCSALVCALEASGQPDGSPGRPGSYTHKRGGLQPSMSNRRRSNIRDQWSSGIRQAILGKVGYSENTGGVEGAAHLLWELGWANSTWTARASKVEKWLRFFDEDMRIALPDQEVYMLAYIGYLSIDGSIRPDSFLQYNSAVSRYHELHHLPTPTKTHLMRALTKAYRRQYDLQHTKPRSLRVGCPDSVIRRIVIYGLVAEHPFDLACCTMVLMAFVFPVRPVSMDHVTCKDMVFADVLLTVIFYVRKRCSMRRPLALRYPVDPSWPSDGNPVSLIRRWVATQPPAASFPLWLQDSMQQSLALAGVAAPDGFHYSAHSPRIGGYNELLVSGFPKEWIMRRLHCETEQILSIYHDSRVVLSDATRWFFDHLKYTVDTS